MLYAIQAFAGQAAKNITFPKVIPNSYSHVNAIGKRFLTNKSSQLNSPSGYAKRITLTILAAPALLMAAVHTVLPQPQNSISTLGRDSFSVYYCSLD